MPFDPSKPSDHSPLASGEMRSQLNALNADLQQRATQADLANAIVRPFFSRCSFTVFARRASATE